MTTAMQNEPWTNFLPPVFHWLENTVVEKSNEIPENAHIILPVRINEEKGLEFLHNTDALSQSFLDQIKDRIRQIGWQGTPSHCTVTIDNKTAILVSAPKSKIPAIQQARQIGIDVASILATFKVDQIVFLSTSVLSATEQFAGFSWGLYSAALFTGKRPSPTDADRFPQKTFLIDSSISESQIQKARQTARSAAFARMLQDAPANWLYPEKMAAIATDVAKEFGFETRVLSPSEMEELGMGSFLAVGHGSDHGPRLIVIEIPGENTAKNVCLVGKGLTFDAGGISIKPASGMDEMKYDMSGAAAVLGAMHYFGTHKPATNVICLIGAAENMVSARSTRPGDIVTSMSGKTIEIANTDAEGRLVLADVLTYAIDRYHPELIVDIATLTGAVLHGLGSCGAAFMTEQDEVANMLQAYSSHVGEPMWRLPLWPELEKEVKSNVADLNNIAKPNVKAGTIMGGHFLREFVGETPWAHFDIAGAAWSCQAAGYPKSGGVAFGMRTLIELGMRFESLKSNS